MKNKAAQELGRLGGKVSSEAKAEAARSNGAKGGRPSKLDRSLFPGEVKGVMRNGGKANGTILGVAVRDGDTMLLCGPDGSVRERCGYWDGRGQQILRQCTDKA